MGVKAPRRSSSMGINRGDIKDTDPYNNYTLNIDIR